MEPATYLDHLRRDGDALATAASAAALDAPIPSCPGWDMATLVGHVGAIHRWAAQLVRTEAAERLSRRGLFAPPEGQRALVAWYSDGLDGLIATLKAADPSTPVWNWSPSGDRAARFWHRRMAQETALHRWDAQAAAGAAGDSESEPESDSVDAALAVDGIDEYFEVFLAGRVSAEAVHGLHGSLHLHATDIDGEWWVRLAPDAVERRHEHAKADAAVRGPASSLLLWLWNRVPGNAAGLQAFGDPAVMGQMATLAF